MARKTRKHNKSEVHTIPQLRRLFENIEHFIDSRIEKRQSKDVISKELRKEWRRMFMKEIDKQSADALIENHMKSKVRHTLKNSKRVKGGVQEPLAGAPLEYSTRPGIYLAPNSIPVDGQLPISGAGYSSSGYGNYVDYINSGFWNPEDARSYDPVQGQQPFPQPFASTGSNLVGGKRKSKRRVRGGNALLTQAFTRPFGSDAPPGIPQDMQDIWYGKPVGASPDQVQRPINEIHSMYRPPTIL
jgi:hypothetical protein